MTLENGLDIDRNYFGMAQAYFCPDINPDDTLEARLLLVDMEAMPPKILYSTVTFTSYSFPRRSSHAFSP